MSAPLSTTPIIDYRKIAEAAAFYATLGYEEIAVPWIVGYEAYGATRPPDRKEFYTLGGYLNASGEQSFLDLLLAGAVLKKHLCITPCFREEPELDELHHRYFMKVELIDTDATPERLKEMIAAAQKLHNSFLPGNLETKVIQTDQSGNAFDIVDPVFGVELGSYGIRSFKGFTWIYGTGLALPRLDTVIKKLNICSKNYQR